jgi:predicted Zn-dependent protease
MKLLADIYTRRVDFPQAIAYLEKYVNLNPYNIELLLELKQLYLNVNKQ